MPRRCTVCAHPQRNEIDRELVAATASKAGIARKFGLSEAMTEPKRRIAAHFGLSPAVVRHVKRHITRHAVAPCPDPKREVPA